MKRFIALAALALIPLRFAQPVDISAEIKASSFAMSKDGDLKPSAIGYGGFMEVSDRLSANLFGKLSYDADPVYGNVLSARAMYRTSYMEIAAGPSFGVLNSNGSSDGVPILFQPGLGIGFSVTSPGFVVARADTEFALPAAVQTGGQAYLQKSELSAGFFLPNVLCTLKVSQRTSAIQDGADAKIRSTTDYGFYTTAYKKGSPFRIGLDFIYRVIDYYVVADSPDNRKIANLVLGGGLTFSPKAEYSLFLAGDGSLYSFSLGDPVDGLDEFMFNLRAGINLSLPSPDAP